MRFRRVRCAALNPLAHMDRKDLNTLRYHAQRLELSGGVDADHDWAKAVGACEALLGTGAGPEQLQLRKHLLEFQEHAAQQRLPASISMLVRLLDQAAARVHDAPTAAPVAASAITAVAGLLRGRAVLVIGGLSRPEHVENLCKAFELSEIVWPHTRENDARVAVFEPYIAREDVALVLLLIRWIRHGYGEVSTICERHDKPLVRVPAGYNADQLAALILEQCGRRLRGEA
jgi:hypothetical protein